MALCELSIPVLLEPVCSCACCLGVHVCVEKCGGCVVDGLCVWHGRACALSHLVVLAFASCAVCVC